MHISTLHFWGRGMFFLHPFLRGHFIRLTVFRTKKCAVSGLIMGFIGLKNQNVSLLSPLCLCECTQTHRNTLNQRPTRLTCWMALCCGNDKAIEWSCTLSCCLPGQWSDWRNLINIGFLPLSFFFCFCICSTSFITKPTILSLSASKKKKGSYPIFKQLHFRINCCRC